MSDAPTCDDAHNACAGVTDVLLVIDTVTLLDYLAGAPDKAVAVDGDVCYCLAPEAHARAGDSMRLRWTSLAMRGAHAVLLQLSLSDEAVLGNLRLHVDENAVRYAPQSGKPEEPVARPAPDAFWQVDVVASGEAQMAVEAVVTDRDATVLGRFGWTLRLAVP